ncbi:MAG: methylglyoxal synthase [Imperialibacter sp.]
MAHYLVSGQNMIDLKVDTTMNTIDKKNIALVAHDYKKKDLIEWALFNKGVLAGHSLFATEATGNLVEKELNLPVIKVKSGSMGGNQQIATKISEGEIDILIFFWDPLAQLPSDPEVKALLRIGMAWNIPVACNRATADFLVSSPLLNSSYQKQQPDYKAQGENLSESFFSDTDENYGLLLTI